MNDAITNNARGIVVFPSLVEALRNGFQVYDRTADGYVVRTRTSAGWAMALVRVKQAS
jgi:hypothetical protein